MEDKGQLVRFVCVDCFWCHLISSDKVVISFLEGNGGEETPLQGGFMFCFQGDAGQQTTHPVYLPQLPSLQNNPKPEWHSLGWHTLNPFKVKEGVQSEGPRSKLSLKPKKIMLPTISAFSPQMFMQTKVFTRNSNSSPARGK